MAVLAPNNLQWVERLKGVGFEGLLPEDGLEREDLAQQERVELFVVLRGSLSEVKLHRRRHPLVQYQSHFGAKRLFVLNGLATNNTNTNTHINGTKHIVRVKEPQTQIPRHSFQQVK